ncbi:hypothetical protein JW707_02880, partial [Candidatus Woesearchaeota archaeon]|nr:hypothetical protein [Candidatus Woesearchaeota archaeon]
TEKDIKKAGKIIVMDEKQKEFIINHTLHSDRANLEKKMHVLDIESPASAAEHHYRQTHEQIKQKLKEKLSELFGGESQNAQ